MNIRVKLLWLLLCIGVLPLLLLTWKEQSVLRSLGTHLASENQRQIEMALTEQLQQAIASNGKILQSEKKLMELALEMQVMAMEQRLADPNPPAQKVYFSSDFDDPARRPPDTLVSKELDRPHRTVRHDVIAIHYDHASIRLSPGISRQQAQKDIYRLASMAPVYHLLYQKHPQLFYWQYTALENGVHSAYPGHGGYPGDYDPRTRDWYQRALNRSGMVWSPPLVDVTTGKIILSHSAPVHHPDGRIAGVTGLDVSMLALLGDVRRRSRLAESVQTFLVRYQHEASDHAQALQALAYHHFNEHSNDWQVNLEIPELISTDQPGFSRMLADISDRKPGYQRMPFLGRDALWIYGPIDDEDNHLLFIADYLDIARQSHAARDAVDQVTWDSLWNTGFAASTMILLVLIAAILASRTVTQRIRSLAWSAHCLAKGEFNTRVMVQGRDELAQLGRSFNRMAGKLEERLQLRGALELAQEVQQNLLPKEAPEIPGYDLAGMSRYAEATGGDYYDFILPGNTPLKTIGVAVGDVSGHGFASALLMTQARALLRANTIQHESPVAQIQLLNGNLCRDAQGGRFMTLFYLLMEPETGLLRWTNAGHENALRYDTRSGHLYTLSGADIPLGVDSQWQFHESRCHEFHHGQWLLIFSDGIPETRNKEGESFGHGRLKHLLQNHAHSTAQDLCTQIFSAVDAFRNGAVQRDDMTVVAIHRKVVHSAIS